jgi:WXG100 family type VII secretion target
MAAAANHVEEVNAAIASQLSQLLQKLDPLAQTWRGQAATSFLALKERWMEDATKLNQALLGISEKLRESQKGYANIEESVGGSFSRITERLG